MKSTHINSWNDLQQFGINPLTGEACVYSMRTLCDLSEKGKGIMCEFFGLHDGIFANSWNSMVGTEPAVASIMLPRGIFKELCCFILFLGKAEMVIKHPDGAMVGYRELDETIRARIVEMAAGKDWEIHRNHNPAVASSRNQHAFTGRTY